MEEPTESETVEILKGIKKRYEEHHKLTILDEALEAAAHLATRYIADRFLPDKAIDLVDEAASRVRIRKTSMPLSVKEVGKALENVRKDKDEAVAAQQYEYAEELTQRERSLREKVEQLEKEWQEEG